MKAISTLVNSVVLPSKAKAAKIFAAAFILLLMVNSGSAYGQACPTASCSANDVVITRVYFGDATGAAVPACTEGQTNITGYVWIELSTNANRNGLYLSGTLATGTTTYTLSNCFSNALNGTTLIQYPTQYTIPCGSQLTLSNVFLSWNSGPTQYCTSGAGTTPDCATVSPKCWRQSPTDYYVVIACNTFISGNTSLCAGSTSQLTGSGTASSTTPWTSSNTSVATISSTGLVTALSAGTSIITYNTAGGCSTTTTVTVTAAPTVSLSGAGTATICSNSTATVSGVTFSNGTINWTENGAGSITAGQGTAAPTYTPAAGDGGSTVTLTGTVTGSGACASTTTTTTYSVVVQAAPSITVTGAGTTSVCTNSTATVSGVSFSNGTIVWTENGAGSITAGQGTAAPTYTPAAGDAGNTVTLTGTVTGSGPCGSTTTSTTYTIQVFGAPTISVTGAGTTSVCTNSTATVSGVSFSNGTIVWTENGAGSITAGQGTNAPTYTPAAGDAGNTVTLTGTVTGAGACGSTTTSTTYSVLVVAAPTITVSGAGTTSVCTNSTATVTGVSFSNGTIVWSEDGAGSITAGQGTNAPTYTPAAGDAGNTVTLTGTVTGSGPCGSTTTSTTYTIQVFGAPTISVTGAGTTSVCTNSTATVSGVSFSNGTIVWTENGAGSITAGQGTNAPTYTPAAGDAGNTVTLTGTVTGAGACGSTTTSTTYSVLVVAAPAITVSGAGTTSVCTNSTATVSGVSFSNGTIVWTENGAGSITAGQGTNAPTYTPAAGDAGNTVTLTGTVTGSGPCGSTTTSTTYTIQVFGAPTISVTGAGTTSVCTNSTATVSGVSFSNGTIVWTENGAGSITAGQGTNAPTYTPAAGDAGNTVTLTGTVTGAGACGSTTTSTTYSVLVVAAPTITVSGAGTTSVCTNSTATVTGVSFSNGTIVWSEDGAGSITAGQGTNAPTYTPAAGDAGNTVTLTGTVTGSGPCGSTTTSTTYTIQVQAAPSITVTGAGTATVCVNNTATVSGVSFNNGTIVWTENGAGSITAGQGTAAPTYTPAAGDAGNTVTLTGTVTGSGPCGSTTTTTTYSVFVQGLPTITVTGAGTSTVCVNGTATVSGVSFTNGTITWMENGFGSITAGQGTATPTYTPAAGDAGTTVTLTGTVNGLTACGSTTTSTTYSIVVQGLPTASVGEQTTYTVCANGTVTIGGTSASNGTISWTENGAGSITSGANTLNPTYTPAAADAGHAVTLTMTVTGSTACGSATASATVTINVVACAAQFTIDRVEPTCYGSTDGKIVIRNISGGTPPYQISKDNGFSFVPVTDPSLFEFLNLGAGVYNIILKMADNQLQPLSTTSLIGPAPMKATLTTTGTATCSSNAVTLNVSNVQGGNGGPYTLSVDGSAFTSATTYTVTAGVHTVTAKDKNGCTMVVGTVNVAGPLTLSVGTPSVTNVTTFGGSNGSISISSTGGSSSYMYTLTRPGGANTVLNAGTATVTFSSLIAGTYTITVMDNNGCGTAVRTAVVAQPQQSPVPPDLVLGSESSTNTFKVAPDVVNLVYHVSNVSLTNAAQSVVLRITKPAPGYTVAMMTAPTYTNNIGTVYTLDNARWTITTNNDQYIELSLTNDPLGQNYLPAQTYIPKHLGVTLTRTAAVTAKGEFTVTGTVRGALPDNFGNDNSTVHQYTAQ